jgi:hypothetical protein
MAFSRRGGDTHQASSFEAEAFTWPGSMAATDFATITVSWYSAGTITCATPSGFVEQSNIVVAGSGGSESKCAVFTRACDGAETGNVIVTLSAPTFAAGILDVYSGDSEMSLSSISSPDGGSGTDATAPSVTGTSGYGLIAIYALTDPPGTTNSAPSGMTLGGDCTAAGTNAARTYWQALSSSGATGTKTWDFTDTRDWKGYSLLVVNGGGAPPITDGPKLVSVRSNIRFN